MCPLVGAGACRVVRVCALACGGRRRRKGAHRMRVDGGKAHALGIAWEVNTAARVGAENDSWHMYRVRQWGVVACSSLRDTPDCVLR